MQPTPRPLIAPRFAAHTAQAYLPHPLQAHGATAAAADKRGDTPLHEAAAGASADIIEALKAKGAAVTAVNHAKETALHIAAKHCLVSTVGALAKIGADVRLRPRTCLAPPALMQTQPMQGPNKYQLVLLYAVREVRAAAQVSKLSSLCTFVLALQIEAQDLNQRTPLHYACYHSTSEVVADLCRLRADVNHVDHKRRTPLHVVVCRQHAGALLWDLHAFARAACDRSSSA